MAGPWYSYHYQFEASTTRCLLNLLRPGQTVLDIGANRGYSTMLAAALVGPSGRVYGFELNPTVMTDLRERVRVNGFGDCVTGHPKALSDRTDEEVVFYISTKAGDSGLSSLTPRSEAISLGLLSVDATVRVRAISLDWCVAESRPSAL